MLPNLTVSDGAYGRIFIAPTVFIGLGRWGNVVLDRFFGETLPRISLKPSGPTPPGAPTRFDRCFGRLSLVRHMDVSSTSTAWAEDRLSWPESLDGENAMLFSDIRDPYPEVRYWATPTSNFREAVDEQVERLRVKLNELFSDLGSARWAQAWRVLGLTPPNSLNNTGIWIVTVGSLFEPDVAALVPAFERVQNKLIQGQSQCTVMHVLDTGLPADPRRENSLWINCPHSLRGQLISSLSRVPLAATRQVLFFSTSENCCGFGVSMQERTTNALGLLRCCFMSTLLSPHNRSDRISEVFRTPLVAPASTADRSAVFLEFILDQKNMAFVVARELLAGWKKQVFSSEAAVATLDQLMARFEDRLRTPDAISSVLEDLIVAWFHGSCNPTQKDVLDSFRTWVKSRKNEWVDQVEALERQSQPSPAPESLWTRIKRFFGFGPAKTIAMGPPRKEGLLEKIGDADTLLRRVDSVLALFRRVEEPESEFQDRTDDEHYEIREFNSATYIATLRRLPLEQDWPDPLKVFFEQTRALVADVLLTSLATPDQAVRIAIDTLERHWHEQFREATPDTRWRIEGISQWIRSDCSLARHIGVYISRKLIPLWTVNPGKPVNWQGFLTVFDYGVSESSDPSAETSAAFSAIRAELAASREGQSFGFGISNHTIAEATRQDIHWEPWPTMDSIGFLWTDIARTGKGFAEDWYKAELHEAANKFRAAYPEEARWMDGITTPRSAGAGAEA